MGDRPFKIGPFVLISLALLGLVFIGLARMRGQDDLDALASSGTPSELAINYSPMRTLICSRVWQHLKPRLTPLKPYQPHLMITFSAMPGTGISTCARSIANLLHGQILSSNELRHALRYLGFNPQDSDQRHISWLQYVTAYCLDQLATGGYGIIILDKTIDRTYPLAAKWCRQYGWILKVIRFEYPSPEACLDSLSHHPLADQYRRYFDSWWKDYTLFQGPIDLKLVPIHPSQELPVYVKTALLKWVSLSNTTPRLSSETSLPNWLTPSETQTRSLHSSINPQNIYL